MFVQVYMSNFYALEILYTIMIVFHVGLNFLEGIGLSFIWSYYLILVIFCILMACLLINVLVKCG